MPVETSAVPHDLLKPVSWSQHNQPGRIEEEYNLRLNDLLGKFYDVVEKRPLLDVVKGHHERGRLWERYLSTGDRLAAAVGRLKYRWNFWDIRSEEGLRRMFVLKVYDREGNIKRPSLIGRQLLKEICDILRRNSSSEEAFRELNNLLSDYPSDSRFPLVSLKSHHWLADSIRRSRGLRKLCEERKSPSKLYLLRISVPPVNFHRLRDLRAFREFARKAINAISRELSQHLPLIIGDEAYFTAVDVSEVREVEEGVRGTQLPLRFRIHEWSVERVEVGGREEFLIKAVDSESYHVGESEPPEYSAERAGKWASELEEADNVLWVRVGLVGTLEDSAKSFLDRAEEILEGLKVEDIPPVERIEQEIDLSPDIMVSLADGLDQFYDDCGRIIAGDESMEDVTVLKSLEESVYVKGLEDKSKVLDIIDELVNLSGKVLTDVWLSFVLCDGKHPFWRVYELLKYEQALFIVKSGRVLKITTEDVPHIRRITQMLERGGVRVSRGQFMEIVKEARRVDGPEPLKLLIDAKFREGKLARGSGAQVFVNNLRNLVDALYNNHNKRMDAVVEALDLISSYIKPQRGVEEEEEWIE
jgi:hypothetical protein